MDFEISDSGFPDLAAGFPTAFATATPLRTLNRVEKAAVVVRLLLQQGVALSLNELPEEAQDDLILNMTKIRTVDRTTVAHVVDEFLAELDTIGLLFPGTMSRALETLGASLSNTVTSRARAKLGLGDTYDPWERLTEVENESLTEALQEEGPETAAIILTKLKVGKAAEVLSQMDSKFARRVAFAMSQTAAVTPDMVDDIGRALYDQLRIRPVVAFEKGPAEAIGAILNSAPSGTRDDVLQGLDEADKALADAVRKSIFTFANIAARIDPRDVPKILRNVDQKFVLTALAAAAQDPDDLIGPFILSNMSSRLAQQLKDDMETLGKIKPKDAEEAQNEIVAAIRMMQEAGDLVFRAEEDETEDADA